MKPFPTVSGEPVPDALVRFDPVDWPAGDPAASLRLWLGARLVFARRYPEGPLGDPVDELRRRADVMKQAGRG